MNNDSFKREHSSEEIRSIPCKVRRYESFYEFYTNFETSSTTNGQDNTFYPKSVQNTSNTLAYSNYTNINNNERNVTNVYNYAYNNYCNSNDNSPNNSLPNINLNTYESGSSRDNSLSNNKKKTNSFKNHNKNLLQYHGINDTVHTKHTNNSNTPQLFNTNTFNKTPSEETDSSSNKHPVMLLNEIQSNLPFKVVNQQGPSHNPTFTIKLHFMNKDFFGIATSKKQAKFDVAKKALKYYSKNIPSPTLSTINNTSTQSITNNPSPLKPPIKYEGAKSTNPHVNDPVTTLINKAHVHFSFQHHINSMYNGYFECTVSIPSLQKSFQAYGLSKKLSKMRASTLALKAVFNIDCKPESSSQEGSETDMNNQCTTKHDPTYNANLFMKLTNEKFMSIVANTEYTSQKVIAAFIMTWQQDPNNNDDNDEPNNNNNNNSNNNNNNSNNNNNNNNSNNNNNNNNSNNNNNNSFKLPAVPPVVVSVASGTKCINGEFLSDCGTSINDCHAEILARRGFKKFLIVELDKLLDSKESIFKFNTTTHPPPTSSSPPSSSLPSSSSPPSSSPPPSSSSPPSSPSSPPLPFRLKDGIKFHLYISTSTCGDARVFSPHDLKPPPPNNSNNNNNYNNGGYISLGATNECNDINLNTGNLNKAGNITVNNMHSRIINGNITGDNNNNITGDNNNNMTGDNNNNMTGDNNNNNNRYNNNSDGLYVNMKVTSPKNKLRGTLRTKIESGEGTIPVGSFPSPIQSWDGVLQGERLRIMSCSAKVMRWNVLGCQGSLLSELIGPVYLTSITFGSLFNLHHASRALIKRCQTKVDSVHAQSPVFPYKLNVPCLGTVTNPEPRRATKSPNFASTWHLGMLDRMEAINTQTGKLMKTDETSSLSKVSLFRSFLRVQSRLEGTASRSSVDLTYSQVKAFSGAYQAAKVWLRNVLAENSCGTWICKPLEQDMFCVD